MRPANPVVTCTCGLKTREPFKIGGELLCAVCAERIAPGDVIARARQWYQAERPKKQRRWAKLGVFRDDAYET